MKKLISLMAGLAFMPCANFTAYAKEIPYPQTENEYYSFANIYPDFYRVDDDSVYFLDLSTYSENAGFIVSSNDESDVKRDTYGFVFSPKEDGKYIVSVTGYEEMYVLLHEPVDGTTDIVVKIPEIHNYEVDVTEGEISVNLSGEYQYSKPYDSEMNFLDRDYFSFVNGMISGKSYITNLYSENDVTSYFCVNSAYSEEAADINISDEEKAVFDGIEYVSGCLAGDYGVGTCDIMNLCKIKALSDGNVTVTVDGKSCDLNIRNKIFHYAEKIGYEIQGDANGDGDFNIADAVTLQGWLLNKPDIEIQGNAVDFNGDNIIDVFDFCLMKKSLSEKLRSESVPALMVLNYDTYCNEEYGWYTNFSVEAIDFNGVGYTRDFGRYTGDYDDSELILMGDTIVETGRQKFPNSDNLDSDIKYIAENAEKYKDCNVIKSEGGWEDYGENYLYLLYDEGGRKKYIELCRFGEEFAWLDNQEIQDFVIKLVENGLFADEYTFKKTLEFIEENE